MPNVFLLKGMTWEFSTTHGVFCLPAKPKIPTKFLANCRIILPSCPRSRDYWKLGYPKKNNMMSTKANVFSKKWVTLPVMSRQYITPVFRGYNWPQLPIFNAMYDRGLMIAPWKPADGPWRAHFGGVWMSDCTRSESKSSPVFCWEIG